MYETALKTPDENQRGLEMIYLYYADALMQKSSLQKIRDIRIIFMLGFEGLVTGTFWHVFMK